MPGNQDQEHNTENKLSIGTEICEERENYQQRTGAMK